MARVAGRSGGGGGGSGLTFMHNPTYHIHGAGEITEATIEKLIRKGHSDFESQARAWEHEVERRRFHVREDDLS
jgi:hypothetical protein